MEESDSIIINCQSNKLKHLLTFSIQIYCKIKNLYVTNNEIIYNAIKTMYVNSKIT